LRLVFDLEANGLKPTEIWVVVCKDIDTGEYHVFRNPTQDSAERAGLLSLIERADLCIGHNIYGYDLCVLQSLLGLSKEISSDTFLDTFILSRLIDYPRDGHSIEDYGVEFGIEKEKFNDWSRYSVELEERCIRDVDICHRIYSKYQHYINRISNSEAIRLEHSFQLVCNKLHENGFAFNSKDAEKLLTKEELKKLDDQIHETFRPKSRLIRVVTPKYTKFGTLSRTDFRFEKSGDLSAYNGGPFSRIVFEPFNPSSPKQVVEVLNAAGWQPVDKTKTHIEALRAKDKQRLEHFKVYGWTVNENNLNTLPRSAPKAARLLAQRIIFESRRRTLTEWVTLASPNTGRIYGEFLGIGAWTHRMAHRKPNTANIPNEFDNNGKVKLLGAQMRKLWVAPKNRLLVGVDAEGIQLRIFAHYVNDPELTNSLVKGNKADKTDPHSFNQKVLGYDICKARSAAKRFVFALFLGAGLDKLVAILECTRPEVETALERLLNQYPGFEKMRSERFPADAKRGWFSAIDGRPIRIPGETEGTRRHLAMSGYLQSGEAIVMKRATLLWVEKLEALGIDYKLVDLVHDEWQTETVNNMDIAVQIAKTQADSLREVGEIYKLNCPLAGSYWNDDLNDYTIGTNWKVTH